MDHLHEVSVHQLKEQMESSSRWMRCFNPKDSKFQLMVQGVLQRYEPDAASCREDITVSSAYMCRCGTHMTYCILFSINNMNSEFACECTIDLMHIDNGGFRYIKTPAVVKLLSVAA